MDAILTAIQGTPLPTILVVVGLGLIVLALAGSISHNIAVPPERQRITGIVGAVLTGIGIALYVAPAAEPPKEAAPTATTPLVVVFATSEPAPTAAAAVLPPPDPSPTPTPEPTPLPAAGTAYVATFDSAESWDVGGDLGAFGTVRDGVYELRVSGDNLFAWATSGVTFDDGIYTVEARLEDGAADAGYGLIFRAVDDDQRFYLLEVSAGGYTWIGRCDDGCDSVVMLVGSGWTESAAVRTGLGATNALRVEATGSRLRFFVNGIEVGQGVDAALASGEIGLFVELGSGSTARAVFDNFTVLPPDG